MNREQQLEQEERIAKELARISSEKLREEKMRQHIIENRCFPKQNTNTSFLALVLSYFVVAFI